MSDLAVEVAMLSAAGIPNEQSLDAQFRRRGCVTGEFVANVLFFFGKQIPDYMV